MAGIASRIAQGMGLHRDGSTLGLPIFETEMRRRLWYQIAALDGRSAEMTGSAKDMEGWLWAVKPPRNVNDIEIFPGMTEQPTEHVDATEMTDCLLRTEIGHFRKKLPLQQPFQYFSAISTISTEQGDQLVEEFAELMREKYLRYLDSTIPIQAHAIVVAKVSVCVLRLM